MSPRTRRLAAAAGLYAVLLSVTAVFVAPVAVMVAGSLKPDDRVLPEAGSWRGVVPTGPTLDNYRDVFERVPFGRFMLNSLLVNGGIVGFGLVVNSAMAYALARLRWRGRGLLLGGVLAVLVVPFEAIAVPMFYQLTAIGWRDTLLVQVVPFVANPLSIYLFYSFFLEFPREVEDAARVDGAGPLETFLHVVVPNSKAAFASVTIVTFLLYWGMYLWPLLMTTGADVRPLPLAIAAFHTLPPLQWGDIMAFGVMMVAPVVVVFVALQRWFVRGVATTGLKG